MKNVPIIYSASSEEDIDMSDTAPAAAIITDMPMIRKRKAALIIAFLLLLPSYVGAYAPGGGAAPCGGGGLGTIIAPCGGGWSAGCIHDGCEHAAAFGGMVVVAVAVVWW